MELRIAIVIGTRPEGVKLAPVISLLRKSPLLKTSVVSTGQHREMLQDILEVFAIEPDIRLSVMSREQSLGQITSRVIERIDQVFREINPDLVIVQGDTTSAFATSLAAFYSRIPVAHVEAGLRTHKIDSPFPEEANRKLIGTIARIHFAPTPVARKNLLSEGIPGEKIYITGNPVVDALKKMEQSASSCTKEFISSLSSSGKRIILVTFHRRESWDRPLRRVCSAIADLAESLNDVCFVFPVHKNPAIRETVSALLSARPNVYLEEPFSYPDLLYILKHSALVMTDSGGIQEEAPSYNVPVLILRYETERPEIIQSELGVLVGTDRERIVRETLKKLAQGNPRKNRDTINPFGDGRASERIKLALERYIMGKAPLLTTDEEFHAPFGEQLSIT